ncbi:MAG: BamA/TamA family outer membrane protein [Candidatus Aminicenantes bacterium]|nr:MAG: BamA/TamA family outer membrane protein [Candidatus Aminicenantes bacterium]
MSKRFWAAILSLAGVLVSFFSASLLYAQMPETIPLISEINLRIDEMPGSPEMRNIIPMEDGEVYSLKRITESIRQIYQTGLFSDVKVLKEGDQETKLTFLLTRKLLIRKIDFIGNREIPRKNLEENLFALKREGSYSADNLDRAVEEIREILRREGFFQAEIEPVVEQNPDVPEVNISFIIHSVKKYTIGKIDFTGNLVISEQELRKKMRTKEGKEFVPSDLEADLEQIRQSYRGLDYQRAEALIVEQRFDDAKEQVFFVLQILPQEKIEITVIGADVPLDFLKPIWEAQIFEEWGLREGDAKIINHLRKKGYIFATVNSSVQYENNLMRVFHRVSPGERFKIQKVSFIGMEYFTSDQLREKLMLTGNFPLFQKVDGAKLYELPQEVELLYKSHGFSDTHVEVAFDREGNKLKPILSIQEGKQEKIESISIQGGTLFAEDILMEMIGGIPGGGFFQPDIQKDIERLKRYYLNQGVRGTEIVAVVQQVQDNLYSIRFEIEEGQKIRIENIIITGYITTKKNIISRELLVQEGDLARYDAIGESKRKLERLGIFTEVIIDEIPISSDRINLLVGVREGARNYASLGIGMETKSQPRTYAVWDYEFRPRGTAELIRYNIFGTAAQASLVGQLSFRETRGVFSWRQPYFFGLPMETYFNAWLEREARTSFTYEGSGISLTTAKPISKTENMDFLATLRYASRIITELEIEESEIDRRFFPFSTAAISGSYIWEKRDDPFNPTRGFFFSSVLEWAFPYFGTESDFWKTFNKFQIFVPVVPDVTFGATVRLGLARGRVPIHERFFAGGSNSFRGVAFDELGPKDPESAKPVGGKALLLFNFELTFPIIPAFKDLYGTLFFDKGNVFERRKQVSFSGLRNALGLGLKYKTPLGPVRFELGWNLDPFPGEKSLIGFITIGNVF